MAKQCLVHVEALALVFWWVLTWENEESNKDIPKAAVLVQSPQLPRCQQLYAVRGNTISVFGHICILITAQLGAVQPCSLWVLYSWEAPVVL